MEQTTTMNGLMFCSAAVQQSLHRPVADRDLRSFEEVLGQSYRYCLAKCNKNKHLSQGKLKELTRYQKKLITLLRKAADDTSQTFEDESNSLIDRVGQQVIAEQVQSVKHAENFKTNLVELRSKTVDFSTVIRISQRCAEQLSSLQSVISDGFQLEVHTINLERSVDTCIRQVIAMKNAIGREMTTVE